MNLYSFIRRTCRTVGLDSNVEKWIDASSIYICLELEQLKQLEPTCSSSCPDWVGSDIDGSLYLLSSLFYVFVSLVLTWFLFRSLYLRCSFWYVLRFRLSFLYTEKMLRFLRIWTRSAHVLTSAKRCWQCPWWDFDYNWLAFSTFLFLLPSKRTWKSNILRLERLSLPSCLQSSM